MTQENMKDIIAVGFDPEKTFIFTDTEYMWYVCVYIANFLSRVRENA